LSPATFYKLKAKYGGLEVSEARRLRLLEEENSKLKRLLAESVLDNAIGRLEERMDFGVMAMRRP
jgi:putative transposase